MQARWLAFSLSVTIAACGQEGSIEGETNDGMAETHTDVSVDSADTHALFETEGEASTDVAEATVDTPLETNPHVCPAGSAPMDCSPGTGTGLGDQCKDAPSCWVTKVQKAVNDTVATHPEWFDTSGTCPLIKNVDGFLDNVVALLAAQGLCVKRDPNAPNEEITLKKDNAFTENFDVVASTGCARSGAAIYTGYCAPAWW